MPPHKPPAPVVAIDGPSGAGKSTVARAVARAMGLLYLDTGALYRAIGWKAGETGTDPADAAAMAALCARVSVTLQADGAGGNRVLVDGEDVTDRIRTQAVAALASAVSAQPCVRRALLDLQRGMGRHGGVILDGRDIGTVVFPDADVKIFLDADPAERARRRYDELVAKGQAADFQQILAEVNARDHADRTRPIAPLIQAPDARVVDTTAMSADEVIARICAMIRNG
ncbi:MAG: (d)CMP kinase [Nitrospirae bacterium]|nr:(d)CMP kinase [Nitrospirota bacterium]